jgi:alkanesulfonate monooxygenase SsuD/methylene tetrahydromethanopterin reductase-like flavin-dependent oxidoreductase (luciferase family)
MAEKIRFGVNLEFRNPPQFRRDPTELYQELIDHVVWAEGLGYDSVYITEHHFTDDDWAPSPLILLSAIAARTKRIRLSTNIMLLPFYHPVRLAEDGAVLDIVSGGRYELSVGLGYRPEEFAGYGMRLPQRSARADEMLEIIRRLWDGERVTFKGKYFQVEDARLAPRPVQQPHPPILVGGFAPNAIKRAARLGDGLCAAGPGIYEIYAEEMLRLGKDPTKAQVIGGNAWTFCSNDPERTWNQLAPHCIHSANTYAEWMKTWNTPPVYTAARDVEEFRKSRQLRVITPEKMVAFIEDQIARTHLTTYVYMMNEGAAPMSVMREPVELFATKVIPHFR